MDTKKYANLIEDQLQKVTVDLEGIATQNKETGDWIAIPESSTMNSADPNDTGDTKEEWNERRAMMSQLETRFRNLTRAKSKITEGNYGTCEVCGATIEEDRLDANCAARTCKTHIEDESSLPE